MILGVACALMLAAACGDSEKAASTDARDTVTTADADTGAQADVDEGTRCCPLGNCPLRSSCVQGACLPTPEGAGACYLDSECAAGQTCQGATLCGCGERDCTPAAGRCGYPAGCCNSASDCGAGEVCHEGVCQTAAAPGSCWVDGDCTGGQVCERQVSCPCGSNCVAAPGVCGVPGICCSSDAECGDGAVCRGGSCLAAPSPGACYADGDCVGGEVCHGAASCPCGDAECAVQTAPGTCAAAGSLCCTTDADCGAGQLCLAGQGCADAPTGDRCFFDGHCGLGRVCEGASVCACGDATCGGTYSGTCTTLAIPCGLGAPCGVGMRCVIPDTTYCPGAPDPTDGYCVPEVDEGCWASEECHQDARCATEEICTDAAGCAARNVAGDCRAKVLLRDCCDSHRECEDGTECRNQNSSKTCPPNSSAVCLSEPAFGERCWNIDDCPEGYACMRSWICGCNGKCRRSREGVCELPTFCNSNIDCGSDRICARDPECILSPCTTVSTCNPGGVCQPKLEGFCWTHDECGPGNYCKDLRICPPDEECPIPDAPGECAPRAGLGECCTSYKGCENGLRCASVAGQTGCALDFTSVCIPAATTGISCYADDDCGPSQVCSGAVLCACGVDTCTSPPQAGTCIGTVP